MIVAQFRRDRPGLLLTLPLLALVSWWPALLQVPPPPAGPCMPLFIPPAALMQQWPWTANVLGILLTIGIALQLVFLANDAELFLRRNHLPALMFPLLLALAPAAARTDAALTSMPFVLWALRRLWVPHARKNALATLFDAGFLIGAAALVYLPCAFLLVVVWASNAVMRPFHWRDHVVPAVGLGLAFLLCWGITAIFAPDLWRPLDSLRILRPGLWVDMNAFGPLIAALLLFTPPAVVAFARGYQRSVMHGKNLRAAFLAFTLACAIIIAFGQIVTGYFPIVLAAVPLSILFSDPLLNARRAWFAELGAIALLALALWAQWTAGLSSPA